MSAIPDIWGADEKKSPAQPWRPDNRRLAKAYATHPCNTATEVCEAAGGAGFADTVAVASIERAALAWAFGGRAVGESVPRSTVAAVTRKYLKYGVQGTPAAVLFSETELRRLAGDAGEVERAAPLEQMRPGSYSVDDDGVIEYKPPPAAAPFPPAAADEDEPSSLVGAGGSVFSSLGSRLAALGSA